MKLKGVFTALVTPFSNGSIDWESFDSLLQNQIQRGVQGFVVNGTTAESPTLEESEAGNLFDYVRKKFKGPILFGTGSNSTAKTIELTKKACEWGADAALVVVPYYNKPPQRGLVEHFKKVSQSSLIPIVLYNVPGRTITSLTLPSMIALAQEKNIIGIKEASGDLELARQIRKELPDWSLLSGDDGTYDGFMALGGDGVISVASHIIPEAFLTRSVSKYKELVDLLFIEANPIPVKMALHQLGILKSAECRLPLMTMDSGLAEKLKDEMKKRGLLK